MIAHTIIAILLIGITLVFLIFTIFSKTIMLKLLFGLVTSLMIVANFFFARTFISDTASSEVGFINVLDNFYVIGIGLFLFIAAIFLFILLIDMVLWVKGAALRKRRERLEDFVS